MNSETLFLKTYCKRFGFIKESTYYSMKHWKKRSVIACNQINEKKADPSNAEVYYNSYLKRKNTKLVKRSNIITEQLKAIENPNFVDIKSVIIEHSKISHKFSKIIRQAEKVSQVASEKSSNNPLYSKKSTNFLSKKKNNNKQKDHMLLNVMQVLIMLKSRILLILNYNLKMLNLQLKIH